MYIACATYNVVCATRRSMSLRLFLCAALINISSHQHLKGSCPPSCILPSGAGAAGTDGRGERCHVMSCLCSVMLCSPRLRHHLLTLCPPGPMPGRQQQLLGMALVAIAANKMWAAIDSKRQAFLSEAQLIRLDASKGPSPSSSFPLPPSSFLLPPSPPPPPPPADAGSAELDGLCGTMRLDLWHNEQRGLILMHNEV